MAEELRGEEVFSFEFEDAYFDAVRAKHPVHIPLAEQNFPLPSRENVEHHEELVSSLLNDWQVIEPPAEFPTGNVYAAQPFRTGNWHVHVAMIEGNAPESGNRSAFTSVTLRHAEPVETADGTPVYNVFQLNTHNLPFGHGTYVREFQTTAAELDDEPSIADLFIPREKGLFVPKVANEVYLWEGQSVTEDTLMQTGHPIFRIFKPDSSENAEAEYNPDFGGYVLPGPYTTKHDPTYEVPFKDQFATTHDLSRAGDVLRRIKPEHALDESWRTVRERQEILGAELDRYADIAIIESELQRLALSRQQRGLRNPSWLLQKGRHLTLKDTFQRKQPDTFQITEDGYVGRVGIIPPSVREFSIKRGPNGDPNLIVTFPQGPSPDSIERWVVGPQRRKELISMFSRLR